MPRESHTHTFRTEGIVLRHRDAGEADRLLSILTPHHGLIWALARGARKTTSKLGGHLDLLRHVSMSVAESRSFKTVGQVETVDSFLPLHEDLERLSRAVYMAELAERFSVEDAPNVPVFNLLARALSLMGGAAVPDLLVRWYEMRLLQLSGFLPEVGRCVECGGKLEQQDHVFSTARGGLLCPECRKSGSDALVPASVPSVKLLRFMARSDWADVQSLRVPEEAAQQVERILRTHLRSVLDHIIRSAAFMDEVRKWRSPA